MQCTTTKNVSFQLSGPKDFAPDRNLPKKMLENFGRKYFLLLVGMICYAIHYNTSIDRKSENFKKYISALLKLGENVRRDT